MWDRGDGLGHGLLQRPGPATRLVGAAGLAGCWAWASCAVRVLGLLRAAGGASALAARGEVMCSEAGWNLGVLYVSLFSRGSKLRRPARDFCPRGVVVKRSAVRASARARERASLRVLGFSGSRVLGFLDAAGGGGGGGGEAAELAVFTLVRATWLPALAGWPRRELFFKVSINRFFLGEGKAESI